VGVSHAATGTGHLQARHLNHDNCGTHFTHFTRFTRFTRFLPALAIRAPARAPPPERAPGNGATKESPCMHHPVKHGNTYTDTPAPPPFPSHPPCGLAGAVLR
jgi:hypothetical protein